MVLTRATELQELGHTYILQLSKATENRYFISLKITHNIESLPSDHLLQT
jgi:hypothetical protein